MDATLQELKKLAGHDPEGFGDPGPDVDFYMQANEKARAILSVDGDVPQSQLDDFASFVGGSSSFISRAVSITSALADVCDVH